MQNDWSESTISQFTGALLFVFTLGVVVAVVDSHQSHFIQHARPADGPGGYRDEAINTRFNLSQTGVHNRRIPLPVRQQWASEHGMKLPTD